jgi:hypothetical protein
LIHIKYKLIKALFIKQEWEYYFKCPHELLEQIIFCNVNGEFLNILKPHYVAHSGDFKKIAKLGRKNNFNCLSTKDREALTKLTEKHSHRNVWYERLLAVGEFLATGDSFIQVRMNIHREIIDGIAALQMNAACKPELKKHGQVSYTWENGIKTRGIKPRWKA